MKNTKWIKYMTSAEFAEAVKTCDTVIVPCGAIEVYGPHLPMGSDTLTAIKVAELIANRVNALIGPMLEIGESMSLYMYPGTIRLRAETWTDAYKDIMESLIKWGFKKFLFLNMHAGNVPLIGHVVWEEQARHKDIACAQIDWWRFVQPKAIGICENMGYMAHGHASECGTSVMMYLWPEYVRMEKRNCVPPQDIEFVRDSDFISYMPFSVTTSSGTLGDATIATAEKGRNIVQKCVDRIVQYMEKEFGCASNNAE